MKLKNNSVKRKNNSKDDSLERVKQNLSQAEASNDTVRIKFWKDILNKKLGIKK